MSSKDSKPPTDQFIDLERRRLGFEESVTDVEPTGIGAEARRLDQHGIRDRLALSRSTIQRLGFLVVVYLLGFGVLAVLFDITPSAGTFSIVPLIVALAFVFEVMDSAAGMGFGTALAPLLFVLGYDPLAVVPVLLVSEALTGVVAGVVHHEFRNVSFSLRPPSDATRLLVLLAGVGAVASIVSIILVYFALTLPASVIRIYVALLVVTLGVVGLARARVNAPLEYRPSRLAGFAVLAGLNKGIGGGGYGPVVSLGQILSGVYEKSATAITSLAEGVVSMVGVVTFVVITAAGVPINLTLLPSVYAGGFLAAILTPYVVRVVPNRLWQYTIPLYAFVIGLVALALGLEL